MAETTVISLCTCKAGQAKAFLDAAKTFLVPTRKEPGCLSYGIYRNTDQADSLLFLERWKDQAAIDFHIGSPHFKTFMASAGTLLTSGASGSPFVVTIASPFDPANPPQGDSVMVASLCTAATNMEKKVVSEAPKAILNPSRAEAGCKSYDLYQSIDAAEAFILFEVWKGFTAIQAHMGTPHFGAFMARSAQLFKALAPGQYFSVNICKSY